MLFVTLVLVVLALDRVTKIIAIDQLTASGPIAFLPAFLDFALVYNTGGAFGLFEGGGVLFVGVAAVAVIAIIVYLTRARQLQVLLVITLSLISGGAIGNAYDRAVSGAVPDFIHTLFVEFPVFNVADMALTLGEIALIIIVAVHWFGPKKELEEGKDKEEEWEEGD